MTGATNSGSVMIFDLGITYPSYALGSLSSTEFCQLAKSTTFIFSDTELDTAFMRSREIERAISVGL